MKIQDVYTHAHLQKRQGVEHKYIGSTNGITQIHNKDICSRALQTTLTKIVVWIANILLSTSPLTTRSAAMEVKVALNISSTL